MTVYCAEIEQNHEELFPAICFSMYQEALDTARLIRFVGYDRMNQSDIASPAMLYARYILHRG
jgi:hypothetical protein